MPWGKCDDRFWDHPKVMAMTTTLLLPCVGLYWRAISWSNDKLADGHISPAAVRMLGARRANADELVRVGLWEGDWTNGYQVHDYPDFNKSRAQVRADRQKWAGQKAGQRMSTVESTGESAVESPRVSSARIPSPVLPSPVVVTPHPAKRGSRSKGTSPRQQGSNPRANGTSPRQVKAAEKRAGMPESVNDLLRKAAAVSRSE